MRLMVSPKHWLPENNDSPLEKSDGLLVDLDTELVQCSTNDTTLGCQEVEISLVPQNHHPWVVALQADGLG